MRSAYAGIDVAFAKGKLLPVCVCTKERGRLMPLPLRSCKGCEPPRGKGNRAALDEAEVTAFASGALRYLRWIEQECEVRIERIGTDAPWRPKTEGASTREAEQALGGEGISYFKTPSQCEFEEIKSMCRTHLGEGRSVATLPHANKLWMLAGFALFEVLAREYVCIEVYPQATVRTLGCCAGSKFTQAGFAEMLAAAGCATGWVDENLDLSSASYGLKHDRLDAYLSAWVASLPEENRTAYGNPPDDCIWVSRTTADCRRV
jgi:hypothetical protein